MTDSGDNSYQEPYGHMDGVLWTNSGCDVSFDYKERPWPIIVSTGGLGVATSHTPQCKRMVLMNRRSLRWAPQFVDESDHAFFGRAFADNKENTGFVLLL